MQLEYNLNFASIYFDIILLLLQIHLILSLLLLGQPLIEPTFGIGPNVIPASQSVQVVFKQRLSGIDQMIHDLIC